jgi:hypothetical protein
MAMRRSFAVWPVVLMAAFLAGYVPEYVHASRIEKTLTNAGQWKKTCADLLNSRDQVITGLERGDPAVFGELRALYGKTRAAAIP